MTFYSVSSKDEFIKNEISITNHSTIEGVFWNAAYKYIYASNLIVENATASTQLTAPVKNSVVGQALFIRAFCYFHLMNLFGDVPLATTSDYRVNAVLPRTAKSNVMAQVIDDLVKAQNLLLTTYPSTERVKVNKWTAAALLARVYLYKQDFANAEIQATNVINSGMYTLETNLSNVFLKASNEAIWQLRPVNPVYNSYEGNAILPATTSSTPTYLITTGLLNAFEAGDARRTAWVQSRSFASQTVYYPYKYKVYGSSAPLTEYYMMFRLAEQYLIRAEARTMQSNISGAQSDINKIRNRAGLGNTIANDQTTLLNAIGQERRIELLAEWGHRWYDLKRTQRANTILGALKPTTWQSTDVLWPIPQSQINLNPFLTQNPGY